MKYKYIYYVRCFCSISRITKLYVNSVSSQDVVLSNFLFTIFQIRTQLILYYHQAARLSLRLCGGKKTGSNSYVSVPHKVQPGLTTFSPSHNNSAILIIEGLGIKTDMHTSQQPVCFLFLFLSVLLSNDYYVMYTYYVLHFLFSLYHFYSTPSLCFWP